MVGSWGWVTLVIAIVALCCFVAVLQVQTVAPHPAGADGEGLQTSVCFVACALHVVLRGAPSCLAHGGTLVHDATSVAILVFRLFCHFQPACA